jgi:diaminopimelate decarboxylase
MSQEAEVDWDRFVTESNVSTVDAVENNPIYGDDALLLELAETYLTPLYIFHENSIRRKCQQIRDAIPYPNLKIRYACKALTLNAVLKIIRSEGFWIDASSLNEVHRALIAGFAPNEIYYTGEGASQDVYEELISLGILINCTSIDQLRLLIQSKGTCCSVRFNPGEGHGANTQTNTGGPSSKHGIYFDRADEVRELAKQNGVKIVAIHSHIGSGTDLEHWLRIKDKTLALADQFEDIAAINLGGGLPVVYDPSQEAPMPLEAWGAALAEAMTGYSRKRGHDIQLQIEPGRFIVAESGLLLAEAQAIKSTTADETGIDYNFVIVNSGMNHNIRPALYGSYHPIRFVAKSSSAPNTKLPYVVAGYLCESGDVFTADADGVLRPRDLEPIAVGDIMVMAGVGAYSHSLKNEYNSMSLPASVLIQSDGTPRLIERRGTLEDVMWRELDVDLSAYTPSSRSAQSLE